MKMNGHKPTVMFQRYNIIDIKDMRAARPESSQWPRNGTATGFPSAKLPGALSVKGLRDYPYIQNRSMKTSLNPVPQPYCESAP